MLTRTQVARRLGRSLATVRRLEGTELHPTQDARGVHRFDTDEVDAVAQRLIERGTLSGFSNQRDEGERFQWRGTPALDHADVLVNDLQTRLSQAERKARESAQELQAFKLSVVQFLGSLALQLVDIDCDLSDVVIEAMQELSD